MNPAPIFDCFSAYQKTLFQVNIERHDGAGLCRGMHLTRTRDAESASAGWRRPRYPQFPPRTPLNHPSTPL
jgi:hypothetical protein